MAEAENFEEDLFADLYVLFTSHLLFKKILVVAPLSTRCKTSS